MRLNFSPNMDQKGHSHEKKWVPFEAFGITKIEATSIARKRIQKKRAQTKIKRPQTQPKPFIKEGQPKSIPKKKQPSK